MCESLFCLASDTLELIGASRDDDQCSSVAAELNVSSTEIDPRLPRTRIEPPRLNHAAGGRKIQCGR